MGHYLRVPLLIEHCHQLLLLSNGMRNINKIDIKDCAKSSCIVLFQLFRCVAIVTVDSQALKIKAKLLLLLLSDNICIVPQ